MPARAAIFGGMTSSCLAVTTSSSTGPSCAKARRSAGSSLGRILDPDAEDAPWLAPSRRSSDCQIGAGIEIAGGLHFHGDEAKRTVVEDDELDRQAELHERYQIAHQHGEAAVAGQRDRPAGPGNAACAPSACGIALAIEPWLNEPISRRLPFMVR